MASVIQYIHHGEPVFVDEALKGKHRDHCLCWSCVKLKPGKSNNCPIAQELYQFCVKHNTVTPVYECQVYEQKQTQRP